jgi:hypothetical protein
MTSEERRVWLYQELSKRNLLKDDDDNPVWNLMIMKNFLIIKTK